ncbi:MAG TPA: DUF72 domain-containing protein [Actinomycetota bacterium]|nr:DUF72 domain-containing protein [Actinomycetota bacterium]
MPTVHIGTSGWRYDDWRGRFYPEDVPQRKWLEFYASQFPTVEVNNSFYRLPERDMFRRWREQTPTGFIVAVKASRFITHMKRLEDPEEPVALLWERASGLGDRLGPILFQLPPRFPVDVGRLRHLLSVLPAGMRPVFEFRDTTWYTDEVFLLLDGAGAAIVWPDRPGVRPTLPALGGRLYVRFHQGTTRGPGYRRDKLRRWASRIAAADAKEAFIYFNNDPTGAAVRDARTMTELLG